ncbi:MAG TPA: AAA family ATPase [Castellaniella sp.]|nr:AAA family ATPase [Castellaniella sp.]
MDKNHTPPKNTTTHNPEKAAPQPAAHTTLISGADITPRPIAWLWPSWLPKGKLTVLAGAAGDGKTTITLKVAATVSRGDTWPDGTSQAPIGNVVIWSGEDDAADVLVPRLQAMGADLSRIHFVRASTDAKGRTKPFDPAKDLNLLKTAIHQLGHVELLILDPIVSLVRGDMHKANDVRQSLEPVVELAAECSAALIGITHFSKGSRSSNPADRVLGSQAFGALARMVLVAVRDKQTNAGILARAKTNITRSEGGIAYEIEEVTLCDSIQTTRINWRGALSGTAQELLEKVEASNAGGPSKVTSAESFLQEVLANGPVAATEVFAAAERAGHSEAAIKRARTTLQVVSERVGSGIGAHGFWKMRLPQPIPTRP